MGIASLGKAWRGILVAVGMVFCAGLRAQEPPPPDPHAFETNFASFQTAPVPAPAQPNQVPPKKEQPAPEAKTPAKTAKPPAKSAKTNKVAEYYGKELYPDFFPDFPLDNELMPGHQDVQGTPSLEDSLLDQPGKSAGKSAAWPAGKDPRRAPPMYHLGLFWWRDDSVEIVGRGPYKPDMPALEHEIGEGNGIGGAFLGGPENGLTWRSNDGYFSTTFHNLTQLDLREPFQQGDPLHGGFIIPRQRWYFEGKVGDYARFTTSVNRGYASFDVLDSYAEYIVNPEWLMFRVGRMKTPSQYEYISVDEANLVGPERSLYVQSFAGNRQLGAMAHGRLFDRQIEYYVGAFNGQRRSFEDFNSSRDFYSYLDFRPFLKSDITWLQGIHCVGTYNCGEERQPLSPIAVRTMNQLSNSDSAAFVSPTILEFGPNVFENGPRSFFDAELVYYFRSVGFISGYQGGYQDYSVLPGTNVNSPFASTRINANSEFLGVNSGVRTHVPISGWNWSGWWFVTGEEITRRRYLVEPRRPFGYYNGTLNPGAWEVFTKFSVVELGNSIFTGGLVDRQFWTNRATAVEIGFNWYLNHFTKFTFDYQHTFLASPVLLEESTNPAQNRYTNAYDLLLFRTQLFF